MWARLYLLYLLLFKTPRTEVLKFALRMEGRLRKHDAEYKGNSWHGATEFYLYNRYLIPATIKLSEIMDGYVPDGNGDLEQAVLDKAADVGNFAMMVHDVVIRQGKQYHGR